VCPSDSGVLKTNDPSLFEAEHLCSEYDFPLYPVSMLFQLGGPISCSKKTILFVMGSARPQVNIETGVRGISGEFVERRLRFLKRIVFSEHTGLKN